MDIEKNEDGFADLETYLGGEDQCEKFLEWIMATPTIPTEELEKLEQTETQIKK